MSCGHNLSFFSLSLDSLYEDHSSLRRVGSERIDLMDVAHCCFALKYPRKLRAQGSITVSVSCILILRSFGLMQSGIGTQMMVERAKEGRRTERAVM